MKNSENNNNDFYEVKQLMEIQMLEGLVDEDTPEGLIFKRIVENKKKIYLFDKAMHPFVVGILGIFGRGK